MELVCVCMSTGSLLSLFSPSRVSSYRLYGTLQGRIQSGGPKKRGRLHPLGFPLHNNKQKTQLKQHSWVNWTKDLFPSTVAGVKSSMTQKICKKQSPKRTDQKYVSICYTQSASNSNCCLLSNSRYGLFGPGTPKGLTNIIKSHLSVSQLNFEQQLKKTLKQSRTWKNDTHSPQTVTFSSSSRMLITLGIFTVTSNFGSTAAEPKENTDYLKTFYI